MNSTLSKVLIFAAGAAIGSAVTWKLIKEKYERIAQEEIDSVKEVFKSQNELEYEHSEESVIGKVLNVEEHGNGVTFTVKSDNPETQEY